MTTAKTEGDRHHYVPQFYLRKFARNGQLKVHFLSGGAPSLKPVRNTAMLYDFYAVPEHTADPGVLESGFSSIERRADYLFRRIEGGEWPLPRDERIYLARFIALQSFRGPEVRNRIASTVKSFGDRERRTVVDAGASTWIAARGGPRHQETSATRAWNRAADEVFNTTIGASFHAAQIDQLTERALPSLVTRAWSVVRFDMPSLIGCDTPVCGVSPSGQLTPPAALLKADRIAYPLGRSTALVLGRPGLGASKAEIRATMDGKSDATIAGSADRQAALNEWTAKNAEEILFHHPDDEDNLVPGSGFSRAPPE